MKNAFPLTYNEDSPIYIPIIIDFILKNYFSLQYQPLHLQPAGLIRPAPVETPQGRNTARIDGCSGAM